MEVKGVIDKIRDQTKENENRIRDFKEKELKDISKMLEQFKGAQR